MLLPLVHAIPAGTGAVRLVDYLKAHLVAVPVTEIGDLITSGFVAIEIHGGVKAGRTIDIVTDGDRILVDAAALTALERAARWNPPWDWPIPILHEDDDMLVVSKPAGMHVHPLGNKREHTLVNALVSHAGCRDGDPWAAWRPHVVQRLDYVVSGLLVIAKNAESKAALVREQKRYEVRRTYVAMTSGVVAGDNGVIDGAIGRDPFVRGRRCVSSPQRDGLRALTRWRVLARHHDRTLVELSPETGRTHQLRVHLASIGHPIVGDRLYQPADPGAPSANRDHEDSTTADHGCAIALHASELRLRHPRSGEPLFFRLDPPAGFDLAALGPRAAGSP